MPYMWMKPSETPYPSWLTSGPRQDQLNSTTEPNPKCWSIESWVNKNAYCLRPPKKFWKDYFGGNNQFVKLTQLNHNYLWPSTSQKQVNFFQPKPYSHRFLPHPVFINILYDSAGSFPGLSTSASVPDFHVLNGFLPGPLTCKLTDQSEVHPPSVCLLLLWWRFSSKKSWEMVRHSEETRKAGDLTQPPGESVPQNPRLDHNHDNTSRQWGSISVPGQAPRSQTWFPQGPNWDLLERKTRLGQAACSFISQKPPQKTKLKCCVSASHFLPWREEGREPRVTSSLFQHWTEMECILRFEREQTQHLNWSNFPQTFGLWRSTRDLGRKSGCHA